MTPDARHPTPDLAITFAGGGNRAFYQLGLMNRWHDRLFPRVAAVAACSAGACVIVQMLSGRQEEAGQYWRRRVAGITKNFDWRKLLEGKRPAPQGEIYRETVAFTLAEGGFERVCAAPFPIYVLASAFPRLLPTSAAVALGLGLYSAERAVRRAPHPRLARRVGFRPVIVDARTCATADELTDLILASSATPPFTPVGRFRDLSLLDGGMIDNIPAFIADTLPGVRRNLVLMTRPYHPDVIGRQGTRLYIAPTHPTPIGRWDYTRPDSLFDTIAMGEAEAAIHAPALDQFLTELDRDESNGD